MFDFDGDGRARPPSWLLHSSRRAGGARRRRQHLRLEARLGPRLLPLAALVEKKKTSGVSPWGLYIGRD